MDYSPIELPWPPVVGIRGHSGSGKTHLIERLVPRLRGRGLRVAVVKHCSHHIDVDRPGKDSDRIFQSGADVLAVGPDEALLRSRPDDGSFAQWLQGVPETCDVVLVEGFRDIPFPQIRLKGKAAAEDRSAEKDLLVLENAERDCDAAEQAVWDVIARAHAALPVYAAVVMDSCRTGIGPSPLCADFLATLERTVAPAPAGTQPQRVLLVGPGPFPEEATHIARLPAAPEIPGLMGCVLGAMRWHPRARWIMLACDPVGIHMKAVSWLLDHARPGVDAVLAEVPRPASGEPSLAVLEPTVRPVLERAACRGQWSLGLARAAARALSAELPPDRRPLPPREGGTVGLQ